MFLTDWWAKVKRKHLRFYYRLKISEGVCDLAFYGAWELDWAPLVTEKAMTKLMAFDWQTLCVDCRRVKPYNKAVLDTAFVATMIRLVQIADERAKVKGINPDWRFRFRAREQTKVLELAGLGQKFAGRISYEQSRLGFRSPVLILSPRMVATESETGNTT